MKRFATTIVAVIAMVGLMVYMYYTKDTRGANPEEEAKIIYQYNQGDINKFELSVQDYKIAAEKKDGKWMLTEPKEVEADQWAADSIVSKMASLKAERVVAENPSDLEQFGLKDPVYILRFTVGNEEKEFLIGNNTAVQGGYFVKDAQKPTVYRVTADTIDPIFTNTNLYAMMNTYIFRFNSGDENKIVYKMPDKDNTLEVSDNKWKLNGKDIAPESGTTVENDIIMMQWNGVDESKSSADIIKEYGDKLAGSISVYLKQANSQPIKVTFYTRDDTTLYAIKDGMDIAGYIQKDTFDQLKKDIDALK